MARLIELIEFRVGQYDVSYWDKTPVYNNHKRLVNYINNNLEEKYTGLLSKPKVLNPNSSETVIKWYSDNVGETPRRLVELSGKEYVHYKSIYDQKIGELISFSKNISLGGGDNRWGDLVSLAIKHPGEEYIFCGEDDVCIVGWSLEEGPDISTSPFEKKVEQTEQPRQTKKPKPKTKTKSKPKTTQKTTQNKNTPIAGDSPAADEPEEQINFDPIVSNDEAQTDSENISESEDDNLEINDNSNGNGERNNPLQQNEVSSSEPKKMKYWPLLLSLLLIIFLGLLYKRCRAPMAPVEVLPETPGNIIPTDPENIELDQDSVMNVVSDRLNVAIRGDNPDLEQFAKDFKSIYQDEKYEVVYYDTLTSRLQLKVPREEREKIKAELKTKLSQYELLVWTERVFKRDSTPSDPGFRDSRKSWYFDEIKASAAWDVTTGDEEIIIAIIDNGFDITHPELKERVYKPYNVVERSTNVFTNPREKHGTHVASTAIGASDNGSGVSGIAPKCKFMPIQVSDRNGIMTGTAIIDAVLYAVNQGADVVNMSLGMSVGPGVSRYPPYVQQGMIQNMFLDEEILWNEIFEIAETNNTTLVLAGGNENVLIGIDPMQRNNLGIKVSAIDRRGGKASFSNYGRYSTISAPGVEIYGAVPGGNFEVLQGTSMASPIVAGAVGLIKSLDKSVTSEQIIEILTNTGRPVSDENGYVGNLLQLDKALGAAESGDVPELPINDSCDDVQNQIEDLEREIDRLRNQCPDLSLGDTEDTLRMPDVIDNLTFMEGKWKSTSSLTSTNGEQVVIYFEFDASQNGQITLEEHRGAACKAQLAIAYDESSVHMDQLDAAYCDDTDRGYRPYSFDCSPDANGYAFCIAIDQELPANRIEFNLIKIR